MKNTKKTENQKKWKIAEHQKMENTNKKMNIKKETKNQT